MVRQRPWDKHEAAILLDAVIRLYQGDVDRRQAIAEVSRKLRQKANNEGFEIDEIYRNIAGITFQMYSMESAYCGYTVRKPATRLFNDIVAIMKEDYQQYEVLLKEANRLSYTVDYRAEYQEWLVESGLQYKAARNYGNWLNNLDAYANENGYINESIYQMDSIEEMVSLCDRLSLVDDVLIDHKDWLTSLRKFIVYKSNGKVQLGRTRTTNDLSSNPYRTEYQEWLVENGLQETAARNYGNWLNNIALYARDNGYCDELLYEIDEIDKLINLYETLSGDEELLSNHRDYLTSFRKYLFYKTNGTVQMGRARGTRSRKQQTIAHRVAVENNDERMKMKYPSLYIKLHSMSKVYDDISGFESSWIISKLGISIEPDEFKSILDSLSWVTEVSEDVYSFSKFAKPYEPIIDFNKDFFVRVLMLRYQNGMRFDSIDLENFRETYEDIIGESIKLTDKELELCLCKCGVLYQNRVFPAEGIINSSVSKELMTYISESFASGKQVLYYKAIYSDLAEVFAYCFNLTDPMMLKSYLAYACDSDEFYFDEEYMTKEKDVEINHSAEIEDYLLSAGKPLSYEEIYAGLSHVANDVIYNEIKTNPNIILNEKEHYYHYAIFEFSSEDADKISEYISTDIAEDGYCIWSRIFSRIQQTMPLFIENNVYLSSVGIRNAVSKKLSGRFNFDSEVICNRGTSLNMSAVYRLYGQHHAPFSDQDIYKFAKEISGNVIYFDSLSESTVRISKELFVSRTDVYFDIDAIDNALATYLSTGYMLIRDIDSFLVFPNVGYEWNTYLLESFLMYYSEKYMLSNNGRSLNNVAGALVRKGTGYDNFVDVCADILAKSDTVLTKLNSLDYLANQNLLTRRSYSNIEDAITKAKQIRNKKG